MIFSETNEWYLISEDYANQERTYEKPKPGK